jgi:hypothetical protein
MIKVLFVTDLDEFENTDVEGVGVIRHDEFGNVYKWVQNAEASTVTATLSGITAYSLGTGKTTVIKPTTATLKKLAGFWMSAVPGQQYGWVQCKGTGPGLTARSGAASSDTVTSSAAMLSAYIGVNTKEYISQSNAIGLYDHCLSPASLASLASGAVGSGSLTLVFDFKL